MKCKLKYKYKKKLLVTLKAFVPYLFMKYFIVLIFVLCPFFSLAQAQQDLASFAKDYFEHFKKKDFDWIMFHYATFYEVHGDYKNNGNKRWSEKDLIANYSQMRQMYLESLEKIYASHSSFSNAKYLKVKVAPSLGATTEKKVTILFKDTKGRQHFINPGNCFKTRNRHWTYFGYRASSYYYGRLNTPNQQPMLEVFLCREI